jgi:GTP cyclohydrolase I
MNNQTMIQDAIHTILEAVGEDTAREGLRRTPQRVAEMYDEVFAGYRIDPQQFYDVSLFTEAYDDMILVKEIAYYSMCEHHMLPFFGRVHVAYIPDGKIIGLSAIPRIVDMFARRLQVQERMTRQIADTLADILQPQGIGVVVEGSHFCARMRGVKKEQAQMTTRAMLGSFREMADIRREFLALIK